MVERQPCRLPEGTTGVDSRSFAPTSCQGTPSNVPPELLPPAWFANNSGEGSLDISVPTSVPKLVRFALTSVRQTFDPNSTLREMDQYPGSVSVLAQVILDNSRSRLGKTGTLIETSG